ncbi:hypothetical protein [Flavobacterium sp.]|uniref:hypothetical protein n=1 Tax=Flavobacterium sp. TaxID=239 RepID=UPI00262966C3|nr:hypothetical protein [Flavobacterium sp.]
MTKKVFELTEVTLRILEKKPPILAINCIGNVTTSGWSNGQLIPFVYVAPPADGVYEFDFVAEEPTGISTEVISKIKSELMWDNFPLDLKGVKVYSSCNFIIEKL